MADETSTSDKLKGIFYVVAIGAILWSFTQSASGKGSGIFFDGAPKRRRARRRRR